MSSAPSRSNPDAVGNSLGIAVDQIIAAIAQVAASNPVILIDGRSGAGKTTLARTLVARWPLRGRVQLVALDSIYPGWDGLDHGVELAKDLILTPHAKGLVGVWQRWDWAVGEPAEAHAVDPSLPLIVEGAGVLTPATARLADVRVWLESPAASRKQRALARDGETYRPHWDRWARQEHVHVTRDDPMSLATLVFPVP
ncbi:hypothetical protein JNB63_01265 [Microbacterium trichothecenolyticum]|uniref:Aminobenzoate synthetase n=1 Tax=Microbacterium ureisolvens TaxID=2781186 RepID=A0ABS7HUB2_9MICO|nr:MULTISPECIES: hypothetical protein [Microbacterium]MBW9108395.1 hypothetical protein [Microbacterium ureisolvens]MBW9118720.1 hypothetical protein [Microbacterium trichothecenolyticum]